MHYNDVLNGAKAIMKKWYPEETWESLSIRLQTEYLQASRAVMESLPERMKPPDDLVEASLRKYEKLCVPGTYCSRAAMSCALRVALNDPCVLGDLSADESLTLRGAMADRDSMVTRVNKMLSNRRNALVAPVKAKPWSERYTVESYPCEHMISRLWSVFLDGEYITGTATAFKNLAEATRLGLIAQKEQEKAQ